MATTQATNPPIYISQHEPLVWLVSIIFTEQFWDRQELTKASYKFNSYNDPLDATEIPAIYPNYDALYEASADFIQKDENAKQCYQQALEAIASGTLSYYSPPANEWGEKPWHYPERDVDSYQFLIWAEKTWPLSKKLVEGCRYLIQSHNYREEAARKEAHAFPTITPENFAQLRKEPLWRVADAILYIMGHRARNKGKEAEFKGREGGFLRLLQYVVDADKAKTIEVIDYDRSFVNEDKRSPIDTLMLEAKVKPDEFVAWARGLPADLPMLVEQKEAEGETNRPSYCTPDMALMYDAITKFWGEYDLANPNPSVAPMKKDVVAWLLEEAKHRGIEGFSKTRAENMDTIIRCPDARKGGNSL